ncbi:MAG: trehalose-6-phosphate synthase, partial [bacterium]
GAAKELSEAVMFNPFNLEECVEALKTALTMPEKTRKNRMKKMKANVTENNIYRWSAEIVQSLLRLS